MDQLDNTLDELHEINMTEQESNIEESFRFDGITAGYRVYLYREDEECHISVSANNSNVFHASVGNQRYGYGYNRQGNLNFFDHSQGYRRNQSDRNFAVQLYQFWSNL